MLIDACLCACRTCTGVTGGTAVLLIADDVPDRQQPASRAIHVTMAGASPHQVAKRHTPGGPPSQRHREHSWQHWSDKRGYDAGHMTSVHMAYIHALSPAEYSSIPGMATASINKSLTVPRSFVRTPSYRRSRSVLFLFSCPLMAHTASLRSRQMNKSTKSQQVP